MRPTALAGLALSVCGAVGVLTTELIGTAYAGRSSGAAYVLAVSSGEGLRLWSDAIRIGSAQQAMDGSMRGRGMVCSKVFRIAGVSVGYKCQRRL